MSTIKIPTHEGQNITPLPEVANRPNHDRTLLAEVVARRIDGEDAFWETGRRDPQLRLEHSQHGTLGYLGLKELRLMLSALENRAAE